MLYLEKKLKLKIVPTTATTLTVPWSGLRSPQTIITTFLSLFPFQEYIIRILGITHAFVSLCMLVAYYNLKVPLAIFKREKEVARRLEFDGLYLAEQPEDDDIKAHWDKLVSI